MSELTDFLLACIAEDEAGARDAAAWNAAGTARALGEWRRDGLNSLVDEVGRLVVYGDGPAPDDSQAAHIARHDPARVLAECEAKRSIVELWLQLDEPEKLLDRLVFPTARASLDAALRALALPYEGRAGYREEWRP